MTATAPRERRLKMKARRRSPVMLAMGVVTALASAPAAGQTATGQRKPRPAATVAGEPWSEIPGASITLPAADQAPGRTAPAVGVGLFLQTGLQMGIGHHPGRSNPPYAGYDDDDGSEAVYSLDLGMFTRDRRGAGWGGAVSGYWYGSGRRNLGLRALRRWPLGPDPDTYLQLSPGLLLAGQDDDVELGPGALLELEAGNRWIAMTAGVHTQLWSDGVQTPWEAGRFDTTVTVGGRVHGAIGIAALAVLYLAAVASLHGGAGLD